MVSFTAIVFVLGLIFVLYKSIRLLRNVQIAKSTGLPYTISPFLEFEIFTLITTPVLRYFCAEYLEKGNGWPKWARFMIQRWQYEDKYRAHEEFGDVFLVVSPYGLICYTADAAMAMDICTRRNQFTKPRVCCPLLRTLDVDRLTSLTCPGNRTDIVRLAVSR